MATEHLKCDAPHSAALDPTIDLWEPEGGGIQWLSHGGGTETRHRGGQSPRTAQGNEDEEMKKKGNEGEAYTSTETALCGPYLDPNSN